MNYPLISEYIEAIRSAEDNFDKLNNLRPILDDNGNPIMSSGNFAVVFKMKDENTGKLYAVKCFTREQEHRNENYQKIAEELEFVTSPYFVHFRFIDKELFVDTTQSDEEWFPVLVMDWVEGKPLNVYLREHISDDYERQMLAYRFCRMGAWLLSQPFAHGNLKPDNILVQNDGTLILVDYDGMFVPSMKGQKAQELGSLNYHHPLRTEDDFDEHIDDFAIANIALSLKAISLDASLYNKYGTADRLLFSAKDNANMSYISTLHELISFTYDAELRKLLSAFLLVSSTTTLSWISHLLYDELDIPVKNIINSTISEDMYLNANTDELGAKYSSDWKILIKGPLGLSSYNIKDGTEIIADYAFYNNFKLNNVSIPNTVTKIGSHAFENCI